MWGKAAIVGVGASAQGKLPEETPLSLATAALRGHLGINPRLAGSLVLGGATAGALIAKAALAIDAGLASVVACLFADTARTGGSRFDAPAGRGDSWGIWGMFGNAANSALTARRHMALYGPTSEQLGWVAVTCRRHASLNPNAVMREPITLADHQASRPDRQ